MKKIIGKQWFTWAMTVATAILLTAVVVLSVLLAGQYKQNGKGLSAHQQYYNSKCQSYAVQNFNLSKGQIVFIGDSITDLYVLDDYYADLPLAVYNRGIGGDTTQGVLDRLQVSIFDLAPSKIILMIGTNDVNGGLDSEGILQRYEKILQSIRLNLPNTEIFCMSMIPQNKELETYTTIKIAQTTEKILALNPQIERLSKTYQATYMNLFPLLADENNYLIEEYSDDGIHLNANGFEVWTSLIKPYLLLRR